MIRKKIVYVLGNPIEKTDSQAFKLIPKLQNKFLHINFIHLDPTEELPLLDNQNLILIDTVMGLKKVTRFDGLNHWKLSPRVTVHDFDLPLSLGILQKLGKLKDLTIIGIPPKGKETQILKEIKNILGSM